MCKSGMMCLFFVLVFHGATSVIIQPACSSSPKHNIITLSKRNICIGGVMVSVLTSSVVDRSSLGLVKPKTIKLVYASYPLSMQH